MAVVRVQFNSTTTELHDNDEEEGETWGQLCQRFVETKLTRNPPRPLLQLLTSLHPDNRMSRYRFRYGDGNSTVIEPRWSPCGVNSMACTMSEEEGGAVDANVVLRPVNIAASPQSSNQNQNGSSSSSSSSSSWLCHLPQEKTANVERRLRRRRHHHRRPSDPLVADLWIEKVADPRPSPDACGCFATTRTPFPVDDTKTNIVRVRERDDWFFNNEGSSAADDGGGTISISKFNQQDVPSEEDGDDDGDDDTSGGSNGGDDREGIPPSATVASCPRKGRKPRKREETKRTPPNGYVRFADDVRAQIARDNPGLKVYEMARMIGEAYRALGNEERKAYHDAAGEKLYEFKRRHFDPNLPRGGARENKDKKEEEEKKGEAEEGAETAEKYDAVGESESAAVADRPKRPLNAYLAFGKDARPTIRENNPDDSPTEIMRKIAQAYRALGDDEKKRYTDAAAAAMAKFKEEHGDEALKHSGKKKRKKKKIKNNNEAGGPTKAQSTGGVGRALLPATSTPVEERWTDGWTFQSVPRGTGERFETYWFSPAKSYEFRSAAQARRFRDILESVDGGSGAEAELVAMELYLKGEGDRGAGGERKRKCSVIVGRDNADSNGGNSDKK